LTKGGFYERAEHHPELSCVDTYVECGCKDGFTAIIPASRMSQLSKVGRRGFNYRSDTRRKSTAMTTIHVNNRRHSQLAAALVCAAIVLALPGQAAEQPGSARPEIRGPTVTKPVKPGLFPGRVQDLPKVPPGLLEGIEVNPRIGTPSNPPVEPRTDPVWQRMSNTRSARDLGLLSNPLLMVRELALTRMIQSAMLG